LRHQDHARDAGQIEVIRGDVDHAERRPADQSCCGFGLRVGRSDGGKASKLHFSPVKIGIKNVTSLCRSKRFPQRQNLSGSLPAPRSLMHISR
jgi:hypothetical protein